MQARNQKIDFIKFISVFLVIWGHTIQHVYTNLGFFDNPMYLLIYSFHMPLFAFISGFLSLRTFLKSSLKEIIIKKSVRLLYPGMIWGLILEVMQVIYMYPSHKNCREIILGVFTDVWFFWTIFWISVLTAISLKISNGHKLLFVLLLGICTPVLLFLPNGDGNIFMYPYFLMGLAYSKYESRVNKYKHLIGWTSLMVFVCLLYRFDSSKLLAVAGHIYFLGGGSLYNDVYRYLIGFSGTISVTFLISGLSNHVNDSMRKPIERVATLSGEIYCVQCFLFLDVFSKLIRWMENKLQFNPFLMSEFVYSLVLAPILSYFLLRFMIMCVEFANRNSLIYSFLFGSNLKKSDKKNKAKTV